jgi:hypothetical protein
MLVATPGPGRLQVASCLPARRICATFSEGEKVLLSMKKLAVSATLVLPVLLGLGTVSAGAAQSPAVAFSVGHKAVNGHMGPNSNLAYNKKDKLKFAPNTFTLPVVNSKKGCTLSSYQFMITNDSGSTQELTLNGNDWDSLPSTAFVTICTGQGTSVFGVAGTSAKLTVHST